MYEQRIQIEIIEKYCFEKRNKIWIESEDQVLPQNITQNGEKIE